MVIPAPADAILIEITGDTTGFVTGSPPNDATGDLDVTLDLPNPGWTPIATTWEISDAPALGTATIDFTTGEWAYTIDPDEYAQLDDGELAVDTFEILVTGYALTPGGQLQSETATQTITINIEGVCFVDGTLIGADKGHLPVEQLQQGDLVLTRDNSLQEIRWIESSPFCLRDLQKKRSLWPVRIKKDALGPGYPRRDLYVSQQHRLLVGGAQVELFFGTNEVLTSAKSLCHWPGIRIVKPTRDLRYFHILLDQHEILDAEGAPAESLFLGEEALCSMTSDGLRELSEIFPERPFPKQYRFGEAARKILKDREAVVLA